MCEKVIEELQQAMGLLNKLIKSGKVVITNAECNNRDNPKGNNEGSMGENMSDGKRGEG